MDAFFGKKSVFFGKNEALMTTLALALLFGTALIGLLLAVHFIRLQGRFVLASRLLGVIFMMLALSAALLALHLLHDIPVLLRIRALLALLSIPGLYLFFDIVLSEKTQLQWREVRYLVPLLFGICAVLLDLTGAIDLIMLTTLIICIVALLRQWRRGKTIFSHPGDNALGLFLCLQVVIVFLIVITLLDVLILLDINSGGELEQSYPLLFAVISLSMLLIFAMIGALGRPSLFESFYDNAIELTTKKRPPVEQSPDPAQRELAETVKQALYNPDIIADEMLTLTRLARKLGIPARSLSQSINQVWQKSFSELLNDGRIALCQQLMREHPQKPLLDIMMTAGYSSKSNFYKQFVKRVGITPGAYLAAQTKVD